MKRKQLIGKRTFDILLALAGIIVTLIPLCIIGFSVKMTSRGPIFFKQSRIGRNGRPFKCVKIRTMYLHSERHGTVTISQDVRVTPLGRFLRQYKLDELPQLWNVLLGHMSFVGPRPDVPGYVDRLQGEDRRILELYPGITGPATLKFRNEETLLASVDDPQRYNDEVIYPEKVRLNLAYLEHWSFWKDMGYIMLTLVPVTSRRLGFDRWLSLND